MTSPTPVEKGWAVVKTVRRLLPPVRVALFDAIDREMCGDCGRDFVGLHAVACACG